MQDEQYIIDTLGIGEWPEDTREPVVVEATMRIGNAIIDQLSEQQYNEYKAIVDDNHEVINAWLDQNVPGYKDTPAYQSIAAGVDDDPERNNPNKLFATVAWVQKTLPNLQTLIDDTLATYKQELGHAA